MTPMRIGPLARLAGCAAETVRYYEKEGLLPAPQRSAGNYRLYGPQHLARLRFIRHCRALDLGLDDVRRLLAAMAAPEGDCGEVDALVDNQLRQVERRIAELQELASQLRQLRSRCQSGRAVKDCRILRELTAQP